MRIRRACMTSCFGGGAESTSNSLICQRALSAEYPGERGLIMTWFYYLVCRSDVEQYIYGVSYQLFHPIGVLLCVFIGVIVSLLTGQWHISVNSLV